MNRLKTTLLLTCLTLRFIALGRTISEEPETLAGCGR